MAVLVGVVMIASAVLLSPFGSQQTVAKTGLGAMLLAANVVIARTTGGYFDAPAEANPLLNTWSLSVEEQFYLVFPAALLAAWVLGRRLRHPVRLPFLVLGLAGAVSFGLALAGSVGVSVPGLPDSLVGFYGPATRAWEFAVGALLALGGGRLVVSSPRVAGGLALAGGGMLLASLWLITGATPFPGVWTVLPVTGTALLLVAGTASNSVSRWLSARPMVTIGDWSYSIYLWHWPLIVFARLLWPGLPWVVFAAAVFSIVPAYASYRWVEQPLRALPVTRGFPLARLVAVTVVPPLVLAGTLGFAARHGFWNAAVRDYKAAVEPSHAGLAAGCSASVPLDQIRSDECRWNSEASGRPIYVVGDSNADHFIEGVIGAAEALKRPVLSSTANACPMAQIPLVRHDRDEEWNRECRQYVNGTVDYLTSSAPGTVLIASTDSYWTSENFSVGEVREPDLKLSSFAAGLSSVVSALRNSGHTVLVIQTIPHWGGGEMSTWSPCSLLDIVSNGCARTLPLGETLDRQGPTAEAVSDVAAATGASILDLSAEICPGGVCSSVSADGLIRYRDGSHITVEQSEALAETFEAAIAAAG